MNLIENVKTELENNQMKLSLGFIQSLAAKAKVTHHRLTPNCRVCAITLESGHEVVGFSQVLDEENDIKEIGEKIAYERAFEELWGAIGSIAKAVM